LSKQTNKPFLFFATIPPAAVGAPPTAFSFLHMVKIILLTMSIEHISAWRSRTGKFFR